MKLKINKKHLIIGAIVVVVSLIIDQVTKQLALHFLDSGDKVIIPGFFKFALYFNDGAAWSSFSGNFGFLMLMTLVSLVAFSFFFIKVDFSKKLFYSMGISLMFGGLFGNLIDRLFMDGNVVIDFLSFDFGSYSFPIFNIADVCLVVGVFFFIIDILFLEDKRKTKGENIENEEV